MIGGYSEKEYQDTIDSVKNGARFWEQLTRKKPVVPWRYYVFLFSEDAEMNYYTIHFLPALRKKKNVAEFIIITTDQDAANMVRYEAKVPYVLQRINESMKECICKFFAVFYEYLDLYRIIINGLCFSEESDVFKLVGCHGICKSDIAAMSILKLEEVPAEDQLMEEDQTENEIKNVYYEAIEWENEENKIFFDDNIQNLRFEEIVERGIRRLQRNNQITEKDKIILCTETQTTRCIVNILKDYHIVAIIDNDKRKAGGSLDGIPVCQTDDFLKANQHKDYKFIVPTRSYRAICEQLNHYGYKLNKQVFVTYCKEEYYSQAMLEKKLKDIEEGKKLYDELRKEFPTEKTYLCPYPGTGDVFLVGMYLKTMRKEHNETGSFLMVVSSNSCKNILSLFGINAVVVNKPKAERLLCFSKVLGFDKTNLKVLNDGYRLIKTENLRGCKGINFHSLFQISVFDVKEQLPFPKVSQENSDHLFLEHGLAKGKTVLLSPYANTIAPVTGEIWEQIAEILKGKGYTVCTNVASSQEKAIKGTTGLLIPYSLILDFLNKAGGFIGLRSGLCDIIAGTTAKKVIIYPAGRTFDNTTVYNYFSLEKMSLAKDDLKEIEIDASEQTKIIDEIREEF